ncbi:enoyl-CoA hydratase [Acinetobacter suaedae]|uniref:Enoyl-CoA hydratase n=1 Tax=Acinetobacter suaedae TaxID=2609668 RepID=A0A5P1V119_9GAMM|nr:enoyl-CoA hydratase [Acinetobacter sp. C16S1]QER41126.1 enoyl-CoA hydratase [Acinetobacter sp. C16S1]
MQRDDNVKTQLTTGKIDQDLDGKIMTLTMNTLGKKNAISYDMYSAMSHALDQAAVNDEVHVVILTGANQVFTSGNDVNAFSNRKNFGSEPPASIRFLKSLATFPKPIIAKVEGVAIGIGSTMLLHCDLVYASDKTIFQFPFVNLGLVPEAGSSYILPRLLGFARASELILLGEKFSAAQAQNYGIVNKVCTEQELEPLVRNSATTLANKPNKAMQLSKKLLRDMPLDDLLKRIDDESSIFSACIEGDEFKEALAAFQEKRKPVFK